MGRKDLISRGTWVLISVILWVIAWVISEAIPHFNNLLSLIVSYSNAAVEDYCLIKSESPHSLEVGSLVSLFPESEERYGIADILPDGLYSVL